MSALSDAVADTGLDFARVDLVETVLAQGLGERVGEVLGDIARGVEVVRSAAAAVTGAATPAAAVAAVATIVASAKAWLDARDAALTNENMEARATVRDRFVAEYYKPGSWSSVLTSTLAPSPEGLRIVKPTTRTRAQMVAQYDPHFTYMAARVARSPVLVSTWSTPPYSEPGVTPDLWGAGWSFHRGLQGGFGGALDWLGIDELRAFTAQPPAIGAIPGKEQSKYWGNAPNGGAVEAGAKFLNGYAPPPGYAFLFSWGTYPDLSWSPRPEWQDSTAAGAGLALAILSPSPIHVQVRRPDVVECYAHFRKTMQTIPLAPPGQPGPGVWIARDTLLPYSSMPGATVMVDGIHVPWEALRRIEMAYRQFFAVRHAATYQVGLLSPAAAAAAVASTDEEMRSAAQGKPPAGRPWAAYDPAGLGPIYKVESGPKFGQGGPGLGVVPQGETASPSSGGGSGLSLFAVMIALGFLSKWRRR